VGLVCHVGNGTGRVRLAFVVAGRLALHCTNNAHDADGTQKKARNNTPYLGALMYLSMCTTESPATTWPASPRTITFPFTSNPFFYFWTEFNSLLHFQIDQQMGHVESVTARPSHARCADSGHRHNR